MDISTASDQCQDHCAGGGAVERRQGLLPAAAAGGCTFSVTGRQTPLPYAPLRAARRSTRTSFAHAPARRTLPHTACAYRCTARLFAARSTYLRHVRLRGRRHRRHRADMPGDTSSICHSGSLDITADSYRRVCTASYSFLASLEGGRRGGHTRAWTFATHVRGYQHANFSALYLAPHLYRSRRLHCRINIDVLASENSTTSICHLNDHRFGCVPVR